jgi:hypothetical protein
MLIAVSVPMAGCGSHPTCYPAALQLSPATVAPGGQTTLSSPASACALRGIKRATYVVELETLGRMPPVELTRVRPNPDGSFAVAVQVPASTPPGDAVLDVHGSALDAPCHDTSNKCAGYSIGISIQPA